MSLKKLYFIFAIIILPLSATALQVISVLTFEPEMIFIEGGTFTMGCTSEQENDCQDREKPVYQVTLSSYFIGKFPITQAQWLAVMGSNPSIFKVENLPIENVSWNDAQEFIKKLNQITDKQYRLPTEAEWEFAARGGNKTLGYKYSGSNNIIDVAWYQDNSNSKTQPVGTKQPNELGIYDMSGNVWEWCSDWYGNFNNASIINPTGNASGTNRVIRGGCWFNNANSTRVSYRNYNKPDYRNNIFGFRLAQSSE